MVSVREPPHDPMRAKGQSDRACYDDKTANHSAPDRAAVLLLDAVSNAKCGLMLVDSGVAAPSASTSPAWRLNGRRR